MNQTWSFCEYRCVYIKGSIHNKLFLNLKLICCFVFFFLQWCNMYTIFHLENLVYHNETVDLRSILFSLALLDKISRTLNTECLQFWNILNLFYALAAELRTLTCEIPHKYISLTIGILCNIPYFVIVDKHKNNCILFHSCFYCMKI